MKLFGIDALCKDFGGVYLGVNKAVGKHHFEVFHDEDGARIDELTTTTMRGQTLASGDFDIDLGKTDRYETWRIEENKQFRQWLIDNGFDPDDKTLTIGHPKIGQINLQNSEIIEINSDFGKYNIKNFDTIFSKNVVITYLNNKITGEYLDFSLDRSSMVISRNVVYTNLENILKTDVVEIDINTKNTKIFMYDNKQKVNIKSKN